MRIQALASNERLRRTVKVTARALYAISPGRRTVVSPYVRSRYSCLRSSRLIPWRQEDTSECRVPPDYEVAILRVLYELNISAEGWSGLVKRKAAGWNVSCWTQLEDPCDDHLMWNSYAGGPQGVGITVRYGVLKESLAESVKPFAADGVLRSGRVSYRALSLLPFNKHYMFRNEREVRFAFGTNCPGAHNVSIDAIFGAFGVRISPAASVEHRDMVRRLWLSFGGADRVQWPQ